MSIAHSVNSDFVYGGDFGPLPKNMNGDLAELNVFACCEPSALPSDLLKCEMSPYLEDLLAEISYKGGEAAHPLSLHVYSLQELFLNSLYQCLEGANISVTQKITLCLDEELNLVVLDQHPQKEEIEKLLAENGNLVSAFINLAAHSELNRDIINISRIIESRACNMGNPINFSSYHLSLKGGMSHFFFV